MDPFTSMIIIGLVLSLLGSVELEIEIGTEHEIREAQRPLNP